MQPTTSFALISWLLESGVKLSTKATVWVMVLVIIFLVLYIMNEPSYVVHTDRLYILVRAFTHVNMTLFWAIFWFRSDLLHPDPNKFTFVQTHVLHTFPFILVCCLLPYKTTTLVHPKDRYFIGDKAVSIVTLYCVYVFCIGSFFNIWPCPLFSTLDHFFVWICIHTFAWVICLLFSVFHFDHVISYQQPIQHAHQA